MAKCPLCVMWVPLVLYLLKPKFAQFALGRLCANGRTVPPPKLSIAHVSSTCSHIARWEGVDISQSGRRHGWGGVKNMVVLELMRFEFRQIKDIDQVNPFPPVVPPMVPGSGTVP